MNINKKPIDLWSLPIKDQAYFILTGREGSWIYEAMHDEIDDNEGFCARVVQAYKDENPTPCDMVQQYLDESYHSIMEYRASKLLGMDKLDLSEVPLKFTLTIKK